MSEEKPSITVPDREVAKGGEETVAAVEAVSVLADVEHLSVDDALGEVQPF